MPTVYRDLPIQLARPADGNEFPSPVSDQVFFRGQPLVGAPLDSLEFQPRVTQAAYWRFSTLAVGATTALSIVVDWYSTALLSGGGNVNLGVVLGFQANGSSMYGSQAGALTAVQSAIGFANGRVRTTFAPADPLNFVSSAGGTFTVRLSREGNTTLDTARDRVARVISVLLTYSDT